MTLDSETLPYESKPLLIPKLEEIRDVLANGLKSNFKTVEVEVIDCPNLTQAPFHLTTEGICGRPVLLEVGGVPYLLPLVDRSKIYDLKTMCEKAIEGQGYGKEIYVCGAGAGPYPFLGTNVEGIFNFKIKEDGAINQGSHVAKVQHGPTETCELHKLPETETRAALLGNVLICEAKPGKVVHVNCKVRTGNDDFITSIRKTLASQFTGTVGLGGVFILKSGKAKQHVMRDFSKTPIRTEEELNTWLKFFEMPAELINLGTLITDEADLDLRLQHFHSFSTTGWGGHYHIDTTPEIVEYDGYFVVAEKIIRVDKPVVTHKFGRD